ncbi:MAG: hypothetical protein CMJ81_10785 [Planctomycetaceae bacterium]|nr:hypothetical protein [Planctomycetaceae bacterium]
MLANSTRLRMPTIVLPVVTTLLATIIVVQETPPAKVLAQELAEVGTVEVQPLLLHVQRLREALNYLGQPLPEGTSALLDRAAKAEDAQARKLVQQALDPYCLLGVMINPESRVKVKQGPARPKLVQNGWSQFLVKVENQARVTGPLAATSPNADKLPGAEQDRIRDLWLDLELFNSRPLTPTLMGIRLEYRIIQLYSRDAGKRSAIFSFDVGQGTQDIGFRNDVLVTFDCSKAVPVELRVLDENGQPSTAAFEIRDPLGRVYPSQAKRLAPDFAFHPQIYRHDTETVDLPPGEYDVEITRGPEYLKQQKKLVVTGAPASLQVRLKRWVDPSLFGWWSGDHHIHAAGCAHYSNPSEGVLAVDMFRHCQGEDLKVGANLTWGPCFDYQKQFFTGMVDKVSRYPYLLRYDVEVSGFGSHSSGHLCLLRLKQQIPPGGDSKDHWPTLCLNTLRWAKKQGAVCGPAHSGWGLEVPGTDLPNYNVPRFDSIGADEYIVDVTHTVEGPDGNQVPAVDFLSMVDTPHTWELNIWYHILNCGYRTRVSGETDFPCIYGERVGLGRSYVKLAGMLDYDAWCEGIRQGAAYVSDGRSHLLDLTVDGIPLGSRNDVRLDQPGSIRATAQAVAYLQEEPIRELKNLDPADQPYWHIERARLTGKDLEEFTPRIRQVEDKLIARVARDLTGRQAEVERSYLADHLPPALGGWKFMGPIAIGNPSDSNANRVRKAQKHDHGPETTSTMPEPLTGLNWEPHDWPDGEAHEIPLDEFSVGYLHRTIEVNRLVDLDLDMGADDAIRVWCNGEEVADKFTSRPAMPGQATCRVTLKPGTNHLLLKISNGRGISEFYFQSKVHGISQQLRDILNKPVAGRTPEESRRFYLHYGRRDESYQELVKSIDELGSSSSRSVNVELIVNGYVAEQQRIVADGTMQTVSFTTRLERSSWVALRILPSSHTNPVFVTVDDKPIRASRRSARWCLEGVKKCRTQKLQFIDEDETEDFHVAYDHAQAAYEKILAESEVE